MHQKKNNSSPYLQIHQTTYICIYTDFLFFLLKWKGPFLRLLSSLLLQISPLPTFSRTLYLQSSPSSSTLVFLSVPLKMTSCERSENHPLEPSFCTAVAFLAQYSFLCKAPEICPYFTISYSLFNSFQQGICLHHSAESCIQGHQLSVFCQGQISSPYPIFQYLA